MEFITTGNRIAVENFSIGKVYTIVWATGNYKSLACVGKGSDFVMFQDQAPDLLFCLTMDTAITIESIEEGGGGAGTMNYNVLENKPSINGIVLVGNKTGADLYLVSQSDLDDYATNASVVARLATKQDALSSSQLAAVNSGIDSIMVAQIGANTTAIAGKQDALSSSQLAAVNSGIDSTMVAQIGANTTAIAGKQDALSSSQLAAVNSGITTEDVEQINTNKNNILLVEQNIRKNIATINNGTNTAVLQIPVSAVANKSYQISIASLTSDETLAEQGCRIALMNNDDVASNIIYMARGNNKTGVLTTTGAANSLWIYASGAYQTSVGKSVTVANLMLCDKALYDAGYTDYQPYIPTVEDIMAMINQ